MGKNETQEDVVTHLEPTDPKPGPHSPIHEKRREG